MPRTKTRFGGKGLVIVAHELAKSRLKRRDTFQGANARYHRQRLRRARPRVPRRCTRRGLRRDVRAAVPGSRQLATRTGDRRGYEPQAAWPRTYQMAMTLSGTPSNQATM
jgi:hypothetical protein